MQKIYAKAAPKTNPPTNPSPPIAPNTAASPWQGFISVPIPYTGPVVVNVGAPPIIGGWNWIGVDYGKEEKTKEKKKREKDGCDCATCKQFFPYAEPNQDDKETFICYGCRTGF